MDKNEKLNKVRDAIKSYPNFPKPGIIFRDIFGVFSDTTAFQALKDLMVEHVWFLEIDLIVGLDSRGFLLGPLIGIELTKPFLPIRKKGKLPGDVVEKNFTLEYGEATFEIQINYFNKNDKKPKVIIVDDLLATGGSMAAAVNLLESVGAQVIECLVVIELEGLKGREKINVPVHSLIKYD